MIKLVNGVPEKLVEMDEQVRFIEQMDEDNSGPVILINKFNVSPGEVDDFLKVFAATGKVLMGSLDTYLHSYIVGMQVVAYSSTMKSGNLPNNLKKQLPVLNFYRA
jgi:hypothetical protein